jgi:hypothetical protein
MIEQISGMVDPRLFYPVYSFYFLASRWVADIFELSP